MDVLRVDPQLADPVERGMDTPLTTTEERFTFVMNRIRQRREAAANGRLQLDNFTGKERDDILQHIVETERDADMQERTLRILFPERFP